MFFFLPLKNNMKIKLWCDPGSNSVWACPITEGDKRLEGNIAMLIVLIMGSGSVEGGL